jgi:hypothetical protein
MSGARIPEGPASSSPRHVAGDYRTWLDHRPHRGRRTEAVSDQPTLPATTGDARKRISADLIGCWVRS